LLNQQRINLLDLFHTISYHHKTSKTGTLCAYFTLEDLKRKLSQKKRVEAVKMVAVRLANARESYYIIGPFWEIVARLKSSHARFRFRSRRWRWAGSLPELKTLMQPFAVAAVSLSEAQQLQLIYDREHIGPTRCWVSNHTDLINRSVEWWAATRLKKDKARSEKLYQAHKERVATALSALTLTAPELDRAQILALQQTERLVKEYEPRINKWSTEQEKIRRRENLLARFEEEMGLSQENLLEVEASRGASRQALYEELAGLDWSPAEISELKAAAKLLLKQQKRAVKPGSN
jgi:hypothetical protein